MKPDTVYMITGAAKGIGAATAEYVVEMGGRVVVCDIDETASQELCRKLGKAALPVSLDVRDPEAWERASNEAWSAFGRVDVLVNNAGIAIGGLCHELDLSIHKKVVEINLLGVIYGMHCLIPRFLKQGFGHVVNMGSLASFSPTPGLGNYAATKHAVRAFTHSSDIELADTPVGVSLVGASAVETPMLKDLSKDDKALVVFSQKPMPPRKVAQAIVRAAEEKRHEVLVPKMLGAFTRVIGLFPGFLKWTMPSAMKQGKVIVEDIRKKISL